MRTEDHSLSLFVCGFLVILPIKYPHDIERLRTESRDDIERGVSHVNRDSRAEGLKANKMGFKVFS